MEEHEERGRKWDGSLMQEMLFECGLTYSKTFSERNGRQDISGHSDKCMENIQERESEPGMGWRGRSGGKLRKPQVLCGLECQGETYTQRHLEYSLKSGAKFNIWQSGLWRRKSMRNPIHPEKKEFGLLPEHVQVVGKLTMFDNVVHFVWKYILIWYPALSTQPSSP